MVGDQTDGYVVILICLISLTAKLADAVTNCAHRVNVEYGIHILHNNGKTLKTHTGIDVLICKLGIAALAVAVELGKYVVPYFHETVAVTSYLAIRLSAAVLQSAVIVNLGTGAAGTCAMLPEVITLSGNGITVETRDLLGGNADFLRPDVKCLVILAVNGRIQTLGIHSDNLCQELPAPGNGFVLKVITEGEVTEHFKECKMSRGLADVIDIAGTHALLTRRNTLLGRNLQSGKVRLKRCHARVDQKKALVILRNKGKAVHLKMVLRLEKVEVHFP